MKECSNLKPVYCTSVLSQTFCLIKTLNCKEFITSEGLILNCFMFHKQLKMSHFCIYNLLLQDLGVKFPNINSDLR